MELLRIPSISALPAHAAGLSARRRIRRCRPAGRGHGARRGFRDRRPSRRLRGLAARRGQADGPRLRPLRRAAGRSARPVGVAAVRARSSKTAACSPAAPRTTSATSACTVEAAEAMLATRGALPINLKFVFEGEEESSSIHLDAWLGGQPRAARRRISRSFQRHGLLRGQPSGDHGRPARDHLLPDRRRREHGGPALGRSTAAPCENPANALCQIVAALKGPTAG